MAITFLTNEDKNILDGQINKNAEDIGKLSEEIGNLPIGLTAEQVAALDGLFKVAAYIKSDVSAEYDAFAAAFGITDGWTVVRAFEDSEILYGKGVYDTYPYTIERAERACYINLDIPAEANATYKVEFESTDAQARCIIRFWNELAVEKFENQESLADTYNDTTWELSGSSVQAPSLVKGENIARMTISFKNAASSAIPEGLFRNVVIYKHA